MREAKTGLTVIGSIQKLIHEVDKLSLRDEDKLDYVRRRTEMLIRKVFGPESPYVSDYNSILFAPDIYVSDEDEYVEKWCTSETKLLNLLHTMLEEVELFGTLTISNAARQDDVATNRIFLVHGHDGEMTQATARTLEKLGMEPVILEDEANGGRTVAEKLDRYSDVSFAVILLSPDDIAHKIGHPEEKARPRARQNVIHELGYFTGKLGRKSVLVVYREHEDFEMPSNHSGVLYVPFDQFGHWRFALAKELRACEYAVNANDLL